MKKENFTLGFFVFVFLFSVFMLIPKDINVTGFDTSGTTSSNVTISSYLSISMSTNLSHGIIFGNVSALPATSINATHNNDDGVGSLNSTMFLNVSKDSNAHVDFCIKANTHLTSAGGDTIGIGNETYTNSSIINNATNPLIESNVSLTTAYVISGKNVEQGESNYYRFWLNIDVAQAPGDYNNTVSFKGVATGVPCA